MTYGTVDYASQYASSSDPGRYHPQPDTMEPSEARKVMRDMAGEIADFIVALGARRIAKGVFERDVLIAHLSDDMLIDAAYDYLNEAAAEWGES